MVSGRRPGSNNRLSKLFETDGALDWRVDTPAFVLYFSASYWFLRALPSIPHFPLVWLYHRLSGYCLYVEYCVCYTFSCHLSHLEDAGGKGLLPYKNATTSFIMHGLPAGLPFKKANHYGAEQLRAILNAAQTINFELGKWSWKMQIS